MNFFSSCRFLKFCELLVCCGLLSPLGSQAQAPAWQMAMAASQNTVFSSYYSNAQYAAVDAAGNVFVAGTFHGALTLGSITLPNAGGGDDVFVAKWSPVTNTFIWAQAISGTGTQGLGGIAVSGTSIYVTGAFRSSSITLGTLTLANYATSGYDGFVAKLTDAGSTGSFVWAQRLGGTDSDFALGVAVSGNSVYVVGSVGSNPFTLGTLRLTTQAGNGFVTKLLDSGSSGSFVWAQQTLRVGNPANGEPYDDATLYGIAVQGKSLYTVGQFSDRISFGSTTLTSTGPDLYPDVVVARLTDAGSSGSFVAAVGAGCSDIEASSCITAAGSQVYVSGRF